MVLFAYSQRIVSSRQIERVCREHCVEQTDDLRGGDADGRVGLQFCLASIQLRVARTGDRRRRLFGRVRLQAVQPPRPQFRARGIGHPENGRR